MEKLSKIYNSFQLDEIEKDKGPLYHYSNEKAIENIVGRKLLYASNIKSLGDKNEWVYVLRLIDEKIEYLTRGHEWAKEILKEKCKLYENQENQDYLKRYVISTSLDGDSRYMWGNYAHDGGVIKFSCENLVDTIRINVKDESGNKIERNSSRHIPVYHGKVIYDLNKQCDILKNIFDKFLVYGDNCDKYVRENYVIKYAIEKALTYGLYFKKGFESEKEYRLCFITPFAESDDGLEQGMPLDEKKRVDWKTGSEKYYQECIFDDSAIR